jgi:hypothetical protein
MWLIAWNTGHGRDFDCCAVRHFIDAITKLRYEHTQFTLHRNLSCIIACGAIDTSNTRPSGDSEP